MPLDETDLKVKSVKAHLATVPDMWPTWAVARSLGITLGELQEIMEFVRAKPSDVIREHKPGDHRQQRKERAKRSTV